MSSHCAGDDPWACLKLKILLGRTLRVPHLEVGVSHDRIKQACNMGLVTVYNCIYIYMSIYNIHEHLYLYFIHTFWCISKSTCKDTLYIICILNVSKNHTCFSKARAFFRWFSERVSWHLPPLKKGDHTAGPYLEDAASALPFGGNSWGQIPRAPKRKGFMDFSPTPPIFQGHTLPRT